MRHGTEYKGSRTLEAHRGDGTCGGGSWNLRGWDLGPEGWFLEIEVGNLKLLVGP